MGRSSRGILCFGVKLEKDMQQPWDSDKYEGDEDSWWRDVKGFVSTVEHPYDEHGEYNPGFSENDPRIDAYYKEMHEWEKLNPFPYDLQRIGYSEEASFILAVKGKVKSAEWDECIEIFPIMVTKPDNDLLEFCRLHEIATVDDPGWWLSSFYG